MAADYRSVVQALAAELRDNASDNASDIDLAMARFRLDATESGDAGPAGAQRPDAAARSAGPVKLARAGAA
jgi:hypothetical protein